MFRQMSILEVLSRAFLFGSIKPQLLVLRYRTPRVGVSGNHVPYHMLALALVAERGFYLLDLEITKQFAQ